MIADRWNVTDAEVARPYPCDALLPGAPLALWRGVSVAAPPERLWPWVGQIRLAPYSYDWIDNLGRRSPRELRGLPEPAEGDPFTAVAGRPAGRILGVEPGHALTGEILGALMSYVLVPDPAGTRLLLKVVSRHRGPAARLIAVGDWVMARRQLLNLAGLAEHTAKAPA